MVNRCVEDGCQDGGQGFMNISDEPWAGVVDVGCFVRVEVSDCITDFFDCYMSEFETGFAVMVNGLYYAVSVYVWYLLACSVAHCNEVVIKNVCYLCGVSIGFVVTA